MGGGVGVTFLETHVHIFLEEKKKNRFTCSYEMNFLVFLVAPRKLIIERYDILHPDPLHPLSPVIPLGNSSLSASTISLLPLFFRKRQNR